MSKVFLTPIKLANLSQDPVGHQGDIYYNILSKSVKYYDGSIWNDVSSGGSISTIDGGSASSVYTLTNNLDGGSAIGY